MNRLIFFFVLLFLTPASAFAQGSITSLDFFREYEKRTAQRMLYREEDYVQALELALKLAETAPDPVKQAKWQARAAVAMGLQEGRYEEALEYAQTIEDRPYSVQARLELMNSAEDYRGIVDNFRDEEIAGWPPREMPLHPVYWRATIDAGAFAFYHRGRAFQETGDPEAAAADLERADSLAGDGVLRVEILYLLREIYRNNLGDENRLFLTNLKISTTGGGGWRFLRGTIDAASELRRREMYDEALEVINRVNPPGLPGSWRVTGMIELGRIHADAGRFNEAANAFRLVSYESIPATFLLAEMLVETGDREGARGVYRQLLEREGASEEQVARARAELAKLD